jgi:hypothetical protein
MNLSIDNYKLPIIVVSVERSGSTAYSAQLADQYNLTWFSEPHLSKNRTIFENYYNFHKQQPYLVKFIVNQSAEYEIYQQLLDSDCYKIKLLRRNTVDQILSHYIARITGVWNHSKLGPNRDSSAVPIDIKQIEKSIYCIINNTNSLNNLPYKFNEIVYYEDLGNISNHRSIEKLPSPVNADDIKQIIQNLLITCQ